MRTWTLAAVTAALMLAGCSSDPGRDATHASGSASGTSSSAATTTSPSSPSCMMYGEENRCPCPAGAYPVGIGCAWYPSVTLSIHLGQPASVGVPLPHLDRCVAPQDWANAVVVARNATNAIGSVDRGTVLWVNATSAANDVQVTLNVSAKPKCQTFRYDPWSIEPDPQNGTLDVLASGPVDVQARVLYRDGVCFTQEDWQDHVKAAGWATLRPLNGQGTACA